MMIEDRFYDQEWVQNLSNEDFRMLHYLLHFSSKKTGIVELNMRQLNFSANTGIVYTREDILKRFGNMIAIVPGHENTAIFPDYIASNWAKGGKPIDVARNPLYKSIVQELAAYGMTLDDVNAMAKRKVVVAMREQPTVEAAKPAVDDSRRAAIDGMFSKFWELYPHNCPRKVDKQKCLAKFRAHMLPCKDADALFGAIMTGLARWRECSTWNKDGGKYIMAPLRWLNNRNWEDTPEKGNGNDCNRGRTETANSSCRDESLAKLF